ncbi:MAG: glycosyltransferase, partial [Phycisphaerae bacterium]|nr:glycosyltransferase [Phycisphaerae bacterium]
RWSPLRHAPLVHIPIASNTPVLPCDEDTRRLWRRELGAAEEEFLIAHFGILYPHKGLSELLDAVDSLRQEAHNARVMVVGDFDRDADYVAPLTDRIRASGAIWVRGADLEQVSRCLHAADAAALPFHSGASFNRSSMLACLQHGLPTVTTNGPATPPELKDVYDVLLVPVQDASALAGALRKLITDPQLRQELRHRAFRSTAPLSWQAVSRAHGDFYRTLLPTPTELPRENPQRA